MVAGTNVGYVVSERLARYRASGTAVEIGGIGAGLRDCLPCGGWAGRPGG